MINRIEHKIQDILQQYQEGSIEHLTLMLHILALEKQLYRDLVTIEHQLEDNEYNWLEAQNEVRC